MVSGDEWSKDPLEKFSIATRYKYSDELSSIVNNSPLPYDTWRSLFEDFKPLRTPTKKWLDTGRNEIIRYWVNSDDVFFKIDNPDLRGFSPKERVVMAYWGSFMTALRVGRVPKYHYERLKRIDEERGGK
jgi:hypothetical protein